MTLKRNIIASFASQIYVTAVGILMVPIYIQYMGAEAYGLVGFFTMLQAWFNLLDMGLSPTISREVARFNGGASDAFTLLRLVRALEGIFIAIALVGCVGLMSVAGYIASGWLKVQQLPLEEVQKAIIMMAVIVALRWIGGLYRSVINGFEKIWWLSEFNIAVATIRFVLVIPIFIYLGTSASYFFTFQLFVAVVELMVLIAQSYRLLPKLLNVQRIPWQWAPLRNVLKFSLSIAFTSSVWLIVTQTDKLVLSKLLSLTDYAYFTLAVLVAGGVLLVSAPITTAVLPRMTKLSAEANEKEVIRLYRNATQLVGVIATPVALVLAIFAEQVLWAWTGDAEVASKAAPVLTLYALGNGVLAFGAFPYYLQFAKGDVRLHLIGNFYFLILLVPGLIWATMQVGSVGAGYAWLAINLLYFIIWVPMVHGRFMSGMHIKWIRLDISPIIIYQLLAALAIQKIIIFPINRGLVALNILAIGLLLLVISLLSSSFVRDRLSVVWHRFLR